MWLCMYIYIYIYADQQNKVMGMFGGPLFRGPLIISLYVLT